eukprot:365019-Chlamydomonas_euryale.AAC.10
MGALHARRKGSETESVVYLRGGTKKDRDNDQTGPTHVDTVVRSLGHKPKILTLALAAAAVVASAGQPTLRPWQRRQSVRGLRLCSPGEADISITSPELLCLTRSGACPGACDRGKLGDLQSSSQPGAGRLDWFKAPPPSPTPMLAVLSCSTCSCLVYHVHTWCILTTPALPSHPLQTSRQTSPRLHACLVHTCPASAAVSVTSPSRLPSVPRPYFPCIRHHQVTRNSPACTQ